MRVKLELYRIFREAMVELLESWSPLLDFRCRICGLINKLTLWVPCCLFFCILLWVNYVCAKCWSVHIMVSIPLEFVYNLYRFLHLLEVIVELLMLQHLHQGGWARESTSLDNHPQLRYPLIIMIWKLSILVCSLVACIGLGMLSPSSTWPLFCCVSLFSKGSWLCLMLSVNQLVSIALLVL